MLTSRVIESRAKSATVMTIDCMALSSLQGTHSGQELGEVERLDQVVVGAWSRPVTRHGPCRGPSTAKWEAEPWRRSLWVTSSPVTLGIRQSRMATSYS